jgi:hypothetical protein
VAIPRLFFFKCRNAFPDGCKVQVKMIFGYDLHVHTSRYSSCSHSSAESMCREAVKMRLSGIALTEHDQWWPTLKLERLRTAFPDLTIFRGIECSAAEGHFLVFFPEDTSVEEIGPGNLKGLVPKVRDLDLHDLQTA